MKTLELLKEFEDIINSSGEDGKVTFYFNKAYQARVERAIKELEDLKSRSCENCYESKTCKILHSVYKDRLKKEGYAMHKNEFKCGFWHSLF